MEVDASTRLGMMQRRPTVLVQPHDFMEHALQDWRSVRRSGSYFSLGSVAAMAGGYLHT